MDNKLWLLRVTLPRKLNSGPCNLPGGGIVETYAGNQEMVMCLAQMLPTVKGLLDSQNLCEDARWTLNSSILKAVRKVFKLEAILEF